VSLVERRATGEEWGHNIAVVVAGLAE